MPTYAAEPRRLGRCVGTRTPLRDIAAGGGSTHQADVSPANLRHVASPSCEEQWTAGSADPTPARDLVVQWLLVQPEADTRHE